jgi:glycosyl transferase family 25
MVVQPASAVMNVPVVYINLDSDTQRRSRLEDEFSRFGVMAQRLEAVRWTLLDKSQQEACYSEHLNAVQYHAPLVNGEKGCYASHILAWRQLLASEASCMVVLEDDVSLTANFLPVVAAVAELDIPWDMVKLMGRDREKIARRRSLWRDFELIDYARVPSFTAAYAISRRGAEKLLSSRLPFGRPIDVDLRFWWENQLSIYGVWPSVITLDESSLNSSIQGRKVTRSWSSRWRKLRMKWLLMWGNAMHRWRRRPPF